MFHTVPSPRLARWRLECFLQFFAETICMLLSLLRFFFVCCKNSFKIFHIKYEHLLINISCHNVADDKACKLWNVQPRQRERERSENIFHDVIECARSSSVSRWVCSLVLESFAVFFHDTRSAGKAISASVQNWSPSEKAASFSLSFYFHFFPPFFHTLPITYPMTMQFHEKLQFSLARSAVSPSHSLNRVCMYSSSSLLIFFRAEWIHSVCRRCIHEFSLLLALSFFFAQHKFFHILWLCIFHTVIFVDEKWCKRNAVRHRPDDREMMMFSTILSLLSSSRMQQHNKNVQHKKTCKNSAKSAKLARAAVQGPLKQNTQPLFFLLTRNKNGSEKKT